MGLKIKLFGWRHPILDQLSRIKEGLISNGCEVIEDDGWVDCAYSNNDDYSDILDFASKQEKRPFVILNVLDIQLNKPNYPIEKLKDELLQADAITCISKTTQNQIKNLLNLESTVIYNPAKPVYSLGIDNKKTFPFLYVGRANSPNKRFNLIKETLELACWPYAYVKVCGPENPRYCEYEGLVDDNRLNELYNGAGITLLTSVFEGIGLSAIESLLTFTPVIGCSDCEAMVEFLPECMICEPKPHNIRQKILEIRDRYDYYRQVAFEYGIKYKQQFSGKVIASRIIDIYEKSKVIK